MRRRGANQRLWCKVGPPRPFSGGFANFKFQTHAEARWMLSNFLQKTQGGRGMYGILGGPQKIF